MNVKLIYFHISERYTERTNALEQNFDEENGLINVLLEGL